MRPRFPPSAAWASGERTTATIPPRTFGGASLVVKETFFALVRPLIGAPTQSTAQRILRGRGRAAHRPGAGVRSCAVSLLTPLALAALATAALLTVHLAAERRGLPALRAAGKLGAS